MGTGTASEAVAPEHDDAMVVAVVGADEVVRRRAIFALAQDRQLVSVVAASADELEPEAAGRTDIVVIACRGRADERTAAIRAARARLPQARAIIIATADANGVHKTLEAGAKGFVFDSDVIATLAPTVRAVRAGQLVVPPMAKASAVRPPLSYRERETLSLLTLGLTNAEIGRRLYVAESTVKCHLTSIFSKLGVRSRHEAIARVLDPQEGLGLGVVKLSGGDGQPRSLDGMSSGPRRSSAEDLRVDLNRRVRPGRIGPADRTTMP
jgi:DNA-binding NarL/FixJ family response regulator